MEEGKRSPKDVTNYVKMELWVIDWDFTDQPTYAPLRRKAGKPVDPGYFLMRTVTIGPTARCGANFHLLTAIGEQAKKYRDMNLKKGDRILVEGRLGYRVSKGHGKQYRIFIESLVKLPDEPMPLYDLAKIRLPDRINLKELAQERGMGRQVIVNTIPASGEQDEDGEEPPF